MLSVGAWTSWLPAESLSSRLLRTTALLVLVLDASLPSAAANHEHERIGLPVEPPARTPARLASNQDELVQCWRVASARTCVIRGPIVAGQDGFMQFLQAHLKSGGSQPVGSQPVATDTTTLSSDPCVPGSPCLFGAGAEQHTINFIQKPYVMRVRSGETLVLANIQLFNLAPSTAYRYSTYAPWRSTGQGTTTWPSIGLAPNATAAFVNTSILYYNPSDTDDCSAYTQKRIFAFRQVWGEDNVLAVNSTTNRIVGPQYIDATIRNGTDDTILGNATVVYQNVSFICMENSTAASPPGAGKH